MTADVMTDVGVGGILALLIIREVLNFLKDRKRSNDDNAKDAWNEAIRQIHELHTWHAKTDQDGVPVWYVRRSLEDAIAKLADNIGRQTDIFNAMHNDISLMRRDMDQSMVEIKGKLK